MKKAIALRLCIVILISTLATAFLSYYFQVKSAKEAMYENSLIRISQISQILQKNDTDIERLKETLKEDYFIRAKAAAYIVQNNPEIIGNLEETRKVSSLLQVDELHLFDTEGTLFAGSEPKYFNYSFHSGEQMQFFLPMLEDTSLQLCQDVLPNTAENKMMQYIAVWREDHQGIIQIGMEPIRLLEAMEKNELPHIFSMVTTEKDLTIFAVDQDSGVILGSTSNEMVGRKTVDFGFNSTEINNLHAEGFNIQINGEQNYCVMQPAQNVFVCVSTTYQNLYQNIPSNMRLVVAGLCLLSVVIILLILKMLDKFIINGIYEMIHGMKKIAAGDLDFRIKAANSPEFVELSNNINFMVISLLETTSKLSLVFQNVNIPIAVYEFNRDMKRVLATNKIGEILMLSQEEISNVLTNHTFFVEKMKQICSQPYKHEKDVYLLGDGTVRYVKIKSFQEECKTLGIIVDVTEEVTEKQRIRYERDVDLLTGLSSRRAFFTEMGRIFPQAELLKTAALLMVDMDNLKHVNDNWGHEYGDNLLKKAAALLQDCEAPNRLAARLSGDEFVLFIYGENSQEEIEFYIDHLYNQIQQAVIDLPNQETSPIRLSGGYVFFPGDAKDEKELLRLADQTMYKVKKSTKGQFAKYEKPDDKN